MITIEPIAANIANINIIADIEQIADGVESSILSGKTGSALLVFPGHSFNFYWPDFGDQILSALNLANCLMSLVRLRHY